MEFFSGLAGLALQFWYLFLVVICIVFFRTSFGKGLIGEFIITMMIKFSLDKGEYHLVKNLLIPSGEGTTQIDHLVVSRYGLFVIEVKNMKGWIFGKEMEAEWTQKLFKKTIRFPNPLRQNYKHIQALVDLVEIDPKKMFSLVVFIGASTFKTPMPRQVTEGRECVWYIKSFREPVLGEYEVKDILERIDEHRLKTNFTTHRKHVDYVKTLHPEKENRTFVQQFSLKNILLRAVVGLFPLLLVFIMLLHFSGIYRDGFSKEGSSSVVNKQQDPAYSFSQEQVQAAMQKTLQNDEASKKESDLQKGDSSSPVANFQYEIMLFSGGVIYTDNAKVVGNKITYVDGNRLTVSINKDAVRSLKRINF